MTKRTSRSASGTPKTSSPSGTFAQTAGTGSKRAKKPRRMGKFGVVVAHIDTLSSQQFRQSLAAAGILGRDGKLARKYRAKKR